MINEVIVEKSSAEELLHDLSKRLKSNKVVGMARLPEPRADQEYRDVIKKIYTLTGSVEPIVMLEGDDGQKYVYTFLITSNLEKGKEIVDSSAVVSGKLITIRGDGTEVRSYSPLKISGGRELFKRIETIANDYEAAYSDLFIRKSKKIDPYYWL